MFLILIFVCLFVFFMFEGFVVLIPCCPEVSNQCVCISGDYLHMFLFVLSEIKKYLKRKSWYLYTLV